jgi:hypothetical protein
MSNSRGEWLPGSRSFPRDPVLAQVSDVCRYFGQDFRYSIGTPQPWQKVSPAMMRVPHLAQKLEARSGACACVCSRADGPWCACCIDACHPRIEFLCLRASRTTAATRQISASQPEAVCRKLWRSMHSPELNTATVSLHDGRLDVDARYTIANTAEAIIALVKVGALENLSFISRTLGPARPGRQRPSDPRHARRV